jgi:hypothetical protein
MATSADNHALPEVEEALVHHCAAARDAIGKGNDLLWAERHRQIDDLLAQWETLRLEAAYGVQRKPALARIAPVKP